MLRKDYKRENFFLCLEHNKTREINIIMFILRLKMKTKSRNTKKNSSNTFNLSMYIGASQHIGRRSEQQDSFGFCDICDQELINENGLIAVLADGMGGLEGGREASGKAVDITVETYANKAVSENPQDALLRAAYLANEEICEIAETRNIMGNMGTTLIAVSIYNSNFYWLSVGDSAIYFLRDGSLRKLNAEHNYGNQLNNAVLKGEISWEYAQNQPERHHLTSFLGLDEIKEIDYSKEPIELAAGDKILLCSDGLTNALTRHEIQEILESGGNGMQDLSDRLINAALERDMQYQDNVTIVLINADGFV